MTTGKLKVALFGCGKMGMHHVQAIDIQGTGTLVAAADPHMDPLAATELLGGNVTFYSDPEELLNSVKPDVVHIVTPPDSHTNLAKLALEHGANIYVEKPFALTESEAQEILDLAKEKNLSVCAAHQVQFQDPGQKYKTYLPLTGEMVHVESYFSFKTVRRYTPVEQIIDILPHPVYLLLGAFEENAKGKEEAPSVELKALKVDAKGEVHALLQHGDTTGVLVVTLNGRPIESYLKMICKNGSINADFILSGVGRLPGPGVSALAQIFLPFTRARQLIFGTIGTILKMIFKKHKSYAGLGELVGTFYTSIIENTPSPVSEKSIIDTVRICELVGNQLIEDDKVLQAKNQATLEQLEAQLSPSDTDKGVVLVTGGTGFLGKVFAQEMRQRGWRVRVIARKLPLADNRVPGVEYVHGDVAEDQPAEYYKDVKVVAHLAAETMGGQKEHERNTIEATRKMITASASNGVKHFINISSIAVLKPGKEVGGPVNERTPVDSNNIGRGPYVWGKLKAEELAAELSSSLDISCKTIRLGPLVDFKSFTPPGRLGRDAGPFFIAMGNPWNHLSVCDVHTASNVIRFYAENFDEAPNVLNLVESKAPKRSELTKMLKENRPELTMIWIPDLVLRFLSLCLKGVLKLMKPGNKPLDLHAAFSAEKYDSSLAGTVIHDASKK